MASVIWDLATVYPTCPTTLSLHGLLLTGYFTVIFVVILTRPVHDPYQ